MNFYFVARRWTRNVIWRWWRGWERQWEVKGLICEIEKKWLLRLDDIPAHFSQLIRDFPTKHETILVPQPPYSPDLTPADFFFSPSWYPYWKDDDLSLSRRLKEIRRKSYAIFHKRHSRNACRTARNAGSNI